MKECTDSFFSRVASLLTSGQAHLVFSPEGETNPWPRLKRIKTGAVRAALIAALEIDGDREVWLLPSVASFRASGVRQRDICIELSAPIVLTRKNVNKTLGDCDHTLISIERVNTDAGIALVRKLTAELQTEIGALSNFVCYKTDQPAPLHDGNQHAEEDDPRLLEDLDTLMLASNLAGCVCYLKYRGVEGGRGLLHRVKMTRDLCRCKQQQLNLHLSQLNLRTYNPDFTSKHTQQVWKTLTSAASRNLWQL